MPHEQYLYVCVFSVDGIEHTMTGFADNPAECEKAMRRILSHRKANTPDEDTQLIRIHFRVTEEEQARIIEESRAKNPDYATTDPLLLHRPQSSVIDFEKQRNEGDSGSSERGSTEGGSFPQPMPPR